VGQQVTAIDEALDDVAIAELARGGVPIVPAADRRPEAQRRTVRSHFAPESG
jgi:hypothetical protein